MPEEYQEEKAELTCIRCPIGCMLTVTKHEDGTLSVTGNTCPRGADYGKKELTDPTRTVTSTVRVKNGRQPMVSIKTKTDIPKEKVKECMEALKGIEAEAPICIGDVILSDVAQTGVDIIATKNILLASKNT